MDFAHRRAGREERDVGAFEIVIVEHLHIEDFIVAKADLLARRIPRGERHHFAYREVTLVKNFKDFRPTLPVAPTTATL